MAQVPPLAIVLDLSRSMETEDVTPSRLAVARAKLYELLGRLPQRPLSLTVYAASAHRVMPFTEDRGLVIELLQGLDAGVMPAQGSRASAGLRKAFQQVEAGGYSQADILLVGDGVDDDAVKVTSELAGRGARVSLYSIATQP